jgi:hypothetical protein
MTGLGFTAALFSEPQPCYPALPAAQYASGAGAGRRHPAQSKEQEEKERFIHGFLERCSGLRPQLVGPSPRAAMCLACLAIAPAKQSGWVSTVTVILFLFRKESSILCRAVSTVSSGAGAGAGREPSAKARIAPRMMWTTT